MNVRLVSAVRWQEFQNTDKASSYTALLLNLRNFSIFESPDSFGIREGIMRTNSGMAVCGFYSGVNRSTEQRRSNYNFTLRFHKKKAATDLQAAGARCGRLEGLRGRIGRSLSGGYNSLRSAPNSSRISAP